MREGTVLLHGDPTAVVDLGYDKMCVKEPQWSYILRGVSIQLGCPLVTHGDYVITFAAEVRFQFRNQFWNPQPKLQVSMYLIFVKPKNGISASYTN